MIGSKVIELVAIGSTNTYAGELFANNDFEDGTIIWAHEQFAGRGQHDHTWNSETGKNLTLTVCLKPRFLAPEKQFQLNKAIALGLLDFIQYYTILLPRVMRHESHIKWPNDIYLGDRKIGGILIDNRIMGAKFETSFVGIGFNINQTRFAPDIPNPVSLIQILGRETLLRDALVLLCSFLDNRYEAIKQMHFTGIDQEFGQSLLGFDQWRYFLLDNAPLEGKIRGVDPSGRLMLENRNGETLFFGHGEIEFIL